MGVLVVVHATGAGDAAIRHVHCSCIALGRTLAVMMQYRAVNATAQPPMQGSHSLHYTGVVATFLGLWILISHHE